ncbi:FMN adenylyltransferase /riboflavin kinase [Herbihabitans rhizosphaerae]|uniref:Riboflavin biosynthesis protein n=1 Tax=Herbihabitans rhizosphaerae TaxID=1872711 RepID=A0A4Q7KCG5_9PSEU|nr:bifunctional riboflavin kinase/FAD synthetase [Herbihabitans rhizosphaerae]RZS30534.1 FMN adenylyltransferase /riboflavin kinase [Herbihabitans rhizosphaerae]
MQRWRGLENLPGGWGRCVATIGVFDGVHRGHSELIGRAVSLAEQRGVPSVLMTFDPHPSEVVRPGSHPAQLTTLRRKAELVEQLGVDVFCVLPFTPELSKVPADEFVHEVLVDRLHVAAVVVGENFTFGHKAAGNVDLLRRLGSRFGFTVEGAKLVTAAGAGEADAGSEITFSSTYIRACIDAGDVAAAAAALGRPHRLEGIVVRGDRRGRELGFPTANLSTPRFAAIPADGIYAGRFTLLGSDRTLTAAISVGTNPTFSGRERRVEAYVLDVDEDFYGQRVGFDFVTHLRGMEKFTSTDALIATMHEDVRRTRELLDDA